MNKIDGHIEKELKYFQYSRWFYITFVEIKIKYMTTKKSKRNLQWNVKEYFFSSIFFSIHGNFKKVYISESNEIDQEWEK